jgi:hypothetical protein
VRALLDLLNATTPTPGDGDEGGGGVLAELLDLVGLG